MGLAGPILFAGPISLGIRKWEWDEGIVFMPFRGPMTLVVPENPTDMVDGWYDGYKIPSGVGYNLLGFKNLLLYGDKQKNNSFFVAIPM